MFDIIEVVPSISAENLSSSPSSYILTGGLVDVYGSAFNVVFVMPKLLS